MQFLLLVFVPAATAYYNDIAVSSLLSPVGYKIVGATTADGAGNSVSALGDINNDGIPDVIIGAPASASSSGSAYVVYGSTSATTANLINALSTQQFRITGSAPGASCGNSVSSAGDFNGDGIIDYLVGAPAIQSTYVVFGISTLPTSVSLLDFPLQTVPGMKIIGPSSEFSGWAVSGIGDVNGDGNADVITGAYTASALEFTNCGAAYVIFGNSASSTSTFSLSESMPPFMGFKIIGSDSNERMGHSVAGLGDVNGDGKPDFIVSSFASSSSMFTTPVAAVVIFGHISHLDRRPQYCVAKRTWL